jgi:hypothetical protein
MKLRIYSNNSPGNYYGYSDYGMAYVNDYYCGQTLSNLKVAGDDFAIDAGLPDGLGLGDSDNEVSGNLHSYAVLHANNYGSLNPGTNHYGLSRLLP